MLALPRRALNASRPIRRPPTPLLPEGSLLPDGSPGVTGGDRHGGCHATTATTSPGPTESPGETRTSVTVPDASALTLFSIFIASRTQIV